MGTGWYDEGGWCGEKWKEKKDTKRVSLSKKSFQRSGDDARVEIMGQEI